METALTSPTFEPEPQDDDLPAPPAAPAATRLRSLDVFRGVTIAGMLLVNNPGKGEAYGPLEHAPWHGWTPTDLVFPFFLFIVGVAIPFSLGRRAAEQTPRQRLAHVWLRALALFMLGALLNAWSASGVALTLGPRDANTPLFTLGVDLPAGFVLLKTLRAVAWFFIPVAIVALLIPWRSRRFQTIVPLAVTAAFFVLMFAIVFANHHAFNNALPGDASLGGGIFRPGLWRIPGILQRIAVCYALAASLALFFGPRLLLTALVILLAGYAALMLACPFPGHETGSLSREDNLERKIDEFVFDRYRTPADGKPEVVWKHTYSRYPDPEGLLSTLPATGTAILGILVGMGLRKDDRPAAERCARLLAWGVVVTLLGCAADAWLMPINKGIWTPSFVLFCGGLAMLGLGTLFYLVDVCGRRAAALPFTIYGMNAIAAFVVAGILVRIGQLVHIARSDGRPAEPLIRVCQEWAAAQVRHASDALAHLSPHLPLLDTPHNTSLAYAILFVLAVFLPMALLYACRIFLKV